MSLLFSIYLHPLHCVQVDALRMNVSELQTSLNSAKVERESETLRLEELLQAALAKVDALSKDEEAQEETFQVLEAARAESEGRAAAAFSELQGVQTLLSDANVECARLRDAARSLELAISDLESRETRVRDELLATRAELAEASAEKLEANARLEEIRQAMIEAQVSQQEKSKEVETEACLKSELDSLRVAVERNQRKLSKHSAEKTAMKEELSEIQSQLDAMHNKWSEAVSQVTALDGQLKEVQAENARLCGHANSKQKIKQHETLKKENFELQQLLKQKQDLISQMSLEIEASKLERRKVKKDIADEEFASCVGAVVRAKRGLSKRDANATSASAFTVHDF